MKELVSIIIPVYNLIGKIERCIDSILKQSVKNFELILVDDGSFDGSEKTCDRYAKLDSRIKVIHKENGGVSSARNIGLENISGELVTFIDGDDFVTEDYLEKLYLGHEDLCIASAYYTDSGAKNITPCRMEKSGMFSVNPNNISIWFDNGSLYSVWACMFRYSIIKKNNLKFCTSLTRGEDFIFMLKYIEKCKNVRLCDAYVYYYVRYGKKGSSSELLNRKNIISLDLLNRYLHKWLKNHKINSTCYYSENYWIKGGLRGYLFETVRNKNLSFKEKMDYFELLFSLPSYKNLNMLFKKTNIFIYSIIITRSPLILSIASYVFLLINRVKKSRKH